MTMRAITVLVWLCLFAGPAQAAEPDYTKDPVLMVHGYFLGEVGSWTWLKTRLVEGGWPEDYLFSLQFANVFGCSPQHGYEIAAKVQEVLAATGREKVDILAHSMGGVDARYYIKFLCGYHFVNDFVSLAGAHQGTTVGCLDPINCGGAASCVGLGDDAWMQNDFLKELNICDMTPWDDIKYTSIWSEFDEIILPASNSILDGAVNIEVNSVVEHALILVSEEAAGYVMAALDGAGSNDNIPTANPPCVELCEVDPGPEPEPEAGPELGPDVISVPEPMPEPVPEVIEQTHDLAVAETTVDLPGPGPEKQGPDLVPIETVGDTTTSTETAQPKVYSHIPAKPRDGGCAAHPRGSSSTAFLLLFLMVCLCSVRSRRAPLR